jgi:hypothetical protein
MAGELEPPQTGGGVATRIPTISAEIESIIRVRDAAERELLWKYAVGGLIVGGLITAGAAAGFFLVQKSADDFFRIAISRVDDIRATAAKLADEFRASEKQWQEERAKNLAKLKEEEAIVQDMQTALVDTKAQLDAMRSTIKVTLDGLSSAAKVIKATETSVPATVRADAMQVSVAAQRGNDLVEHSRYTAFPHYRRGIPISVQFRQTARDRLAAEGFIVARDTDDSSIASTAGEGGRPVEGPHVSYFVNSTMTANEQSAIQKTAQQVADILNQNLPSGLGRFLLKPHADASPLVGQPYYFGLWF